MQASQPFLYERLQPPSSTLSLMIPYEIVDAHLAARREYPKDIYCQELHHFFGDQVHFRFASPPIRI